MRDYQLLFATVAVVALSGGAHAASSSVHSDDAATVKTPAASAKTHNSAGLGLTTTHSNQEGEEDMGNNGSDDSSGYEANAAADAKADDSLTGNVNGTVNGTLNRADNATSDLNAGVHNSANLNVGGVGLNSRAGLHAKGGLLGR